ncbi:glycoside hydrolase family 73 protein [Limosilactobacillus reuteri]|jgi:Muramidase (flagellum-specific)|uniref:glycoside hydrolase family 73 protein n=1 Tax=Limosilactobacillus reuteri TaxID=1598 RepID=UPI00081C081A|nr:glucosaminidase domain-containing protein [Limosilactobacillus reuteri]MCC4502803.1 glucosaminidase domain-containing protein [Limosilactobacillus reuteri]MCH5378476.1 glucosaminidase domain-containing protein [Limosilactobacillus reuteri]OCW63809.1 mannosyl-glycoprotein endo-beta-N-acetylglucosamidase [Limosilactobacillus reuteri]OCW64639.1 mannosyl-glycoprotein endo-beta-N-acetylglucosamidase [Limosilactobacillus reuteri]OCW65402.1 mannosyl-glycoprotein endo-beta-N-acetylglucosamidase [Li
MKECFIVLNRRAITSALIVLTSLNGQPIKADAIQQAQFDANEDVKRAKPIDEEALVNHDEEYIDAYLTEYENAAQAKASEQNNALTGTEEAPEHENIQSSTENSAEQRQLLEEDKKDEQVYQPQQPSAVQAKFINRIAPVAQQIGREHDLYPSIIIAQAALESDWGCSTLGKAPNNNLFGVKGYFARQTVAQPTTEFDKQGHKFQVISNFRQYASEYEALRDYAQTLEAPLYQGVHRQNTKNYREATRALRGRYATDPEYDRKLNQLIDTYQLTKYDDQVNTSNERANPIPMTDRKEESEAMPIVDKHPVQARKNDVSIPPYVPLLGGVGTAGMIEMFRRLLKKRKEHD